MASTGRCRLSDLLGGAETEVDTAAAGSGGRAVVSNGFGVVACLAGMDAGVDVPPDVSTVAELEARGVWWGASIASVDCPAGVVVGVSGGATVGAWGGLVAGALVRALGVGLVGLVVGALAGATVDVWGRLAVGALVRALGVGLVGLVIGALAGASVDGLVGPEGGSLVGASANGSVCLESGASVVAADATC